MTAKLKYFFFLLLITVTAYGLSTLFLSYLDQELVKDLPLPAPEKSSVENKPTESLPLADSLKALAKRTLSPERKQDTAKKASRTPDKPGASSLNLKLLGTVMNEKGSPWAVILDLDNDRQDMVTVGSVVAGARVVSIAKDRVVLNVNGREEILLLGAEGTRSASTRVDQATKESTTSTYVVDREKESTTSTYVVDRETVRENLDNLPSLLTQARAELYFKEGKPEGFQLSQIQKGSILKSVGFQDGDVIRSVNGREIRSLEDAIALYQQLGDRDSYAIGILRGEKPKTLHVKIK
jgi:general secretion pathway protein C